VDRDAPRASSEDADTSQRRRLPASERRRTIVDAALRTFAARGYDAAPMEEIALAAGVSKAVVYDHFSSKLELYTVLLGTIRRDLDAVVETALAPAGLAGEARVRAAVAAFFRYVEEHPEACRLLFVELQFANVSPLGRELEQRVTERIVAVLGDDETLFHGHPERERQLWILAELLTSAVHGLASWWARHPEVPRLDVVERTVALVWPAIEAARPRSRS
jgi:AcrR family transcriptional regulator